MKIPIFASLKMIIIVNKLNLLTIAGILLLAIVSVKKVNAQDFTLSNNLLYDATLTPNLRMGVRLSEQWSLGLTAGYHPWPTDESVSKKFKHLLLAPDVRYWTDSVNVHHFFGFNLIYSHYNIAEIKFPFGLYKSVRDERHQGDFGGIGAYYGYSWPLGRYWNLEAHIGAAIGYTKYDRYECGHCGKKLGDEKKVIVLPQAGVSIVYNIPGRPRKVESPEVLPIMEEPVTAAVDVQPFVPALSPVPEFKGRAGLLQQDNAIVTPVSGYRPYDRTQILRKEKDALFVHFEFGKSLLRTDYRENSATLDRIVEITRQIMTDSVSSVKKILLVGLASFEGNPATNERIALKRALALQHYIQQEVSVPDSMFESVGGGEAWADFRDQLNDFVTEGAANNIGLEKVIEIIDQEPDVKIRERRIKQLDKGRTWAYIREHILKDQRNAGYIRIYYDYVPDKDAATINEANELLTTDCSDCHHEALRLLLTVRDDERAQNALGVAYWLCGQRDEALTCFRRAAANGNANAQENLRQLEKGAQ